MEPPAVDPLSFVRACYAVARTESGRVERIEPDNYSRNHYRANLRLGDDTVAFQCNAHYL